MNNHMKALAILAVLAFAGTAAAQAIPNEYATHIQDALTQKSKDPGANLNDLARQIVSVENNKVGFAELVKAAMRAKLPNSSWYHTFLSTAEETLADHQPGSTSTSAGSSSLVSKSAVTQVMGLAVDAGAMTQSTSGSTSTFTGNALGLYRYVTGHEMFPYCAGSKCDSFGTSAARRLIGSISLDNTNSGTTSAATSGTTSNPSSATSATSLAGSSWRMSSWGIQYRIPLGNRDEAGSTFQKAWNKAISQLTAQSPLVKSAENLNAQLSTSLNDFENNPSYKIWEGDAQAAIAAILAGQAPTQASLEAALLPLLQKLAMIAANLLPSAAPSNITSAYDQYFAARETVVESVEGTLPGLSIAYTNSHPLNEANVSNFKLIFQMQPLKGRLTLAANASADIYDGLPAGSTVGRFRDMQYSGEINWTLTAKKNSPVLSAQGYFQDQVSRAVLTIPAGDTVPGTTIMLPGPAATLLAPKGNIGIAELLLTIPLGSSGTKVPVGVTYATRTDLLTGPEWRAHIGLNFDFDSLFMK
jgi:hypothetical protein